MAPSTGEQKKRWFRLEFRDEKTVLLVSWAEIRGSFRPCRTTVHTSEEGQSKKYNPTARISFKGIVSRRTDGIYNLSPGTVRKELRVLEYAGVEKHRKKMMVSDRFELDSSAAAQ
jgi:hypothetical protein